MIRTLGDGCLDVRPELEEDLVADGEGAIEVLLVCLLLHALSGTLQMLFEQMLNDCTLVEPGLQCGDRACRGSCDPPVTWLSPIHGLESRWLNVLLNCTKTARGGSSGSSAAGKRK